MVRGCPLVKTYNAQNSEFLVGYKKLKCIIELIENGLMVCPLGRSGICFGRSGICFGRSGICFGRSGICFDRSGICFGRSGICFGRSGICLGRSGLRTNRRCKHRFHLLLPWPTINLKPWLPFLLTDDFDFFAIGGGG